MKTHCRDVESLLIPLVVHLGVMLSFSHVQSHADRVKYEVDLSAEVLHRFLEEIAKVIEVGYVGADHRSIATFFSKLVDLTHAQRNGSVCQDDVRTFFEASLGSLPGNRLLIERSEYDSVLSF